MTECNLQLPTLYITEKRYWQLLGVRNLDVGMQRKVDYAIIFHIGERQSIFTRNCI